MKKKTIKQLFCAICLATSIQKKQGIRCSLGLRVRGQRTHGKRRVFFNKYFSTFLQKQIIK